MRKQNSTFKTGFITEAGDELKNNDDFAIVELEEYACYVMADGLNDRSDTESGRLATDAIILAFEAHPSMSKRAISSYLEAANKELANADSHMKLKASILVVVTDYSNMRYGYAGNTRLRFYHEGAVKEQTQDMSLGAELVQREDVSADVLARHEERNNLRTYLGQGSGFQPFVSKKLKLANGDILALYTRGIWENLDAKELDDVFAEAKEDPAESLDDVEELLLSRQPEELENYTLAAVFVNKIFLDPNRRRKIKKIIITSLVILAVVLVISLVIWFMARKRQQRMDEMELRYTNTIEYLQDTNFIRAGEECNEALKLAEKLRLKKEIQDISDYQKLIEALNTAEDTFTGGNYEEAQAAYITAKERSRYADRIADEYIDKKLSTITDYLSVFDYIQLGDTLAAQGDYERAEEKYLQAKSLATRAYFEEGRKDALDSLDTMYESRNKAEEADSQEAKEKASNETGATQLASEGDKAFAEGDYDSANAYYAMALEKYQELGDTAHAELLQTKIASSDQKSAENSTKEQQAESYVLAGKEQEATGDKLEAKKQYLFAKNIYKALKKDDKVIEVNGLIEVLDTAIEQEKAEKESLAAESEAAVQEEVTSSANTAPGTEVNGADKEIGPGVD